MSNEKQQSEKREMTIQLPLEMFTGRNLDNYWFGIKQRAEQEGNKGLIKIKHNYWRNIVIGYVYNRNVKGLSIEEAQKESEKSFPWNKEKMTIFECITMIHEDKEYLDKRDLDEIAFRVNGKPIEEQNEQELMNLEEYISPALQREWNIFCAKNHK